MSNQIVEIADIWTLLGAVKTEFPDRTNRLTE
jgi:hypothetical protein